MTTIRKLLDKVGVNQEMLDRTLAGAGLARTSNQSILLPMTAAFAAGALVGAAGALLFTPWTGPEVRKRVMKELNALISREDSPDGEKSESEAHSKSKSKDSNDGSGRAHA